MGKQNSLAKFDFLAYFTMNGNDAGFVHRNCVMKILKTNFLCKRNEIHATITAASTAKVNENGPKNIIYLTKETETKNEKQYVFVLRLRDDVTTPHFHLKKINIRCQLYCLRGRRWRDGEVDTH